MAQKCLWKAWIWCHRLQNRQNLTCCNPDNEHGQCCFSQDRGGVATYDHSMALLWSIKWQGNGWFWSKTVDVSSFFDESAQWFLMFGKPMHASHPFRRQPCPKMNHVFFCEFPIRCQLPQRPPIEKQGPCEIYCVHDVHESPNVVDAGCMHVSCCCVRCCAKSGIAFLFSSINARATGMLKITIPKIG